MNKNYSLQDLPKIASEIISSAKNKKIIDVTRNGIKDIKIISNL